MLLVRQICLGLIGLDKKSAGKTTSPRGARSAACPAAAWQSGFSRNVDARIPTRAALARSDEVGKRKGCLTSAATQYLLVLRACVQPGSHHHRGFGSPGRDDPSGFLYEPERGVTPSKTGCPLRGTSLTFQSMWSLGWNQSGLWRTGTAGRRCCGFGSPRCIWRPCRWVSSWPRSFAHGGSTA